MNILKRDEKRCRDRLLKHVGMDGWRGNFRNDEGSIG
jgi:hypothetical protein